MTDQTHGEAVASVSDEQRLYMDSDAAAEDYMTSEEYEAETARLSEKLRAERAAKETK